jgi:hypothetical protein
MHRPVDCYSEEVVTTYKTLTAHWPIFSVQDLAVFLDSVQSFFLTPKLKPRKSDEVWFLKTPFGKNTLGQTVMNIILSTQEIKVNGRIFSNKTQQCIGIFHMEEAQVPIDKGMHITGHRYLFYSLFIFMIFIKTSNLLTRSIS